MVTQEAANPDGGVDAHRLTPVDVAAVKDVRNTDRGCALRTSSWRRVGQDMRKRRQLAEPHVPDILPKGDFMPQL